MTLSSKVISVGNQTWELEFPNYLHNDLTRLKIFISTSLMRALRARTANLNTMHVIMCSAFMI